jgi:hypothetical protein
LFCLFLASSSFLLFELGGVKAENILPKQKIKK